MHAERTLLVYIDIANTRVSVIGKVKKCIKITCANSLSKIHLLKKTQARKPEGFYVSEFLTPTNLKVFHNLRNLRKQHPNKIKSVFTRGGNVSYTLHNSDRVFQVSTLSDLNDIVRSDPPGRGCCLSIMENLIDMNEQFPVYAPDIDNYVPSICSYINVDELSVLISSLSFSVFMLNIRSCRKNLNNFLANFCNYFMSFTCMISYGNLANP